MKTITPKNKQMITRGAGPSGAGELPRRGPGAAAMKVRGMQEPTGDKKGAKADWPNMVS